MPAQIQGVLNRLLDAVKQFTLGQRVVALIGLAVLVLGGLALASWAGKPTMAPLYSGLSAQDASAIVDELSANGVPYELTDAGATILVPADKLYAQRLAIASAGLPTNSDGGGYSLLDDMGMTASEFQQEVTYTRAIEGELAKTISAMKGVRTASVKLALPEDSVFVEAKGEPSASVFLETAPGVNLSGEQVQAILHLVSASIEDMTTSNVAVIDSTGKVLSEVGGLGTSLQDGKTVEYQARVAAGIQAMLDRVVGPGNAVVTVNADLDFDQVQRTSETHSYTEGTPPLSQSNSLEEYTGTGGGNGAGVLGPDNIAVPEGEGSENEYRSENNVQNNAINKVTENTVAQPGSVRRQSVSVVVSQDAAANINLPELETLVAAAAGVDEERGDVVEVSRMPFDTTAAQAAQQALEEARKAEEAAALRQTITTAAIAGGLALVLLVGVFIARRRSRGVEREPVDIADLAPFEPEPEEILPIDERPMDPSVARREEFKAIAAEQPAQIANGLRSYLASGSSNR